MEATKEQLRNTYSQRETDDLLKLKVDGNLTDLALSVLDEELKMRNISGVELETQVLRQAEEKEEIKTALTNLASNGHRLAAHFIDFWIPVLAMLAINFWAYVILPKTITHIIADISLLLLFAYIFFKDGFSGQSIGKKMLKIRVIEDESGLPCSLPRSLLRNTTLCLGLFDWISIFGKKQKRIGDYFAETSVVNENISMKSTASDSIDINKS